MRREAKKVAKEAQHRVDQRVRSLTRAVLWPNPVGNGGGWWREEVVPNTAIAPADLVEQPWQ